MIRPHCPECKSTDKPHSKITGLKGVKVLLVYCSNCGSIVGAVEYNPTEELGPIRTDIQPNPPAQ